MKQSIIENFDPNDLHKFLMQSARENFDENREDFNAGMAMLMALVKKYFCDDFDIAIRDNNGWISVDDELPSENQLVLLFDNFGEQTIGKIIKKGNAHNAHNYTLRAIDDEFIFWLITTTDDYHYGTYHDIALISDFAYWQPLPKPPKE